MPNFLTSRQRAIVILLAEGHRNKEIAAALGLSASTVKAHLYMLYRTLGLRGREALALYALEHRLV
jgi:DNA-binding NarL/FixJ family response regulator